MKRLLITGISGFLGQHLAIAAREKGYTVLGSYAHHPIQFQGITTFHCDLLDENAVNKVFKEFRPDAIIHTAALSKAGFCEKNPALSKALNVDVTTELARRSSDLGINFIFTSTDLVFDGTKGNYVEEDALHPIMVYGKHKAEAEDNIRKLHPDGLILRMPLMFGNSINENQSFMQGFLNTLQQGKSINLFHDEYRSPVDAESAALGMLFVIKTGKNGTLHMGGKDRMSRSEWGWMMAEAFRLDHELLNNVGQKDVDAGAPRPKDTSLNSEKAFKLGYDPKTNKEALSSLSKDKKTPPT